MAKPPAISRRDAMLLTLAAATADEGPDANQPATLKIAVSVANAEINIDLRESATGNGTP